MEDESKAKRRREIDTDLLGKISDSISAITAAKRVDDVLLALHSLAASIFSIDASSLAGVLSEQYKDQLSKVEIPSAHEKSERWEVFYKGAGFPTLARILLYDVASSWLSCFPLSARKLVYDVFFVNGLPTEVVQIVVPSLEHKFSDAYDSNTVKSNAERLLELILLENEGVLKLVREFGGYYESEGFSQALLKPAVARVAQLVASIPDKTRLGGLKSLSSHLFFKTIVIQLLDGAGERILEVYKNPVVSHITDNDGGLQFVGEMFTRICRRGSTDLLLSEAIPQISRRVQNFLSSGDSVSEDSFKSEPSFQFWFLLMEVIRDTYTVERMAEQIMHQLAAQHVSDVEAYWVIWILFHRLFEHQTSVRLMFIERFLLWKVFPFCCQRWILQFAVFGYPEDASMSRKDKKNHRVVDTLQRLIPLWSKREFVQSTSVEQQAYITAALGLLLEKLSKEELDSTKDIMHSILQGVSCRLENPDELVRRMGSSIALAFSKVIDPKNPLYLDDYCRGENIDWEFGLAKTRADTSISVNGTLHSQQNTAPSTNLVLQKESEHEITNGRKKKSFDYKLVDPDEIIDPATLNDDDEEEEDGNESEESDASSDSSLQPYDLEDDDTDLKRNFSQLVDVVGALRKSDDPDGLETALNVAEKLIRASPDELRHIASELVRTLIQVRCFDAVVDGEEESAEAKRQKALVALLVTCPFESVDTINKLLYSPHIDVSQRIMILDVMTEAAEELANTKTVVEKRHSRPLISTIGESPSWFLPRNEDGAGPGPWREISDTTSPLRWTHRFERELPSKLGQIRKGKTRRMNIKTTNMSSNKTELSLNKFPLYAAAFMLPAMQGFDKKRHGVDLLGRDFIVLGKLIHMLGVCMKCVALHPEAFALALPLLDMISSREVCHHNEAYVRRSVLFAASCILMALHPSYVASALIEGNQEVTRGLEWVRTWALHVADSDTDKDCYTMAMACLQLHAEMSLQASRALESPESTLRERSIRLPSDLSNAVIKLPKSSSSLLG